MPKVLFFRTVVFFELASASCAAPSPSPSPSPGGAENLREMAAVQVDEPSANVRFTTRLEPSLRVTEENKAVYIGLLVEHYLVGFCRVELSVLAEGFYDVLPADVLRATADPRGDRRVEVHKGPDADAQIGVRFDATHPVIAAIDPNGAAAEAGLEVDDIVLSINGRPVVGPDGKSTKKELEAQWAELTKLLAELTGTIVFVVRKWQPPRITALDLELIIAGLPGLDVGDQLAVEKVTKLARPRDAPYRRNEVVVFNPPQSFKDIVNSRARNEALIKRVVAVAGDTVEVRGGKLYVNGRAQDEAFINEQPAYALDRMVVPAGHVFVLGDNRNQSLDGHVWGFLPTKNVIGRAVFKYWPPGRVGPVPFPEGSYA